ncbi:hypothetical protein GNF10_28550 [Nostoc sp. UCD121]|uniref:hypothetical protein n=1 Tax=unclassified Nostoc TaxID=2593658 RepID=UPI001623211A|nr:MULTISPECIES: hypothetical protein [unclassified Nostoc]MBC1220979.1 hypothetical protein [Nostoc sp. UCD120]MBC1279799.1 hypothetical protein [Nostoc sp. UCD121]MBC1298000.1 hypothetical protein [Nostoc sp. UCD122]
MLVGDIDHLPSVSPGQILADLINSGRVPVAHCWEFRVISDDGVVFSEQKLYYTALATLNAGCDWIGYSC